MNDLMMDNMQVAVDEDADVIQLVGMKLGDEEYAIDVLKIQEIIRTVEITIVPRSEVFILGVMNLRGKVIPVVDLRIRFNLDKVDFDKSTRIIVVRFEKENIGFVVDEVTQVIRINRNMVEPTPPLVGAVGQEYILGICKYKERLMILLDIDRVVGESEVDSSLRQRFTAPSVSKSAQKFAEFARQEENLSKQEPAKPFVQQQMKTEPVKPYSMADEVKGPVISNVASSSPASTTSEDELLNDVVQQAQLSSTADQNHVEQGELDALIAQELAKREAETDELNKRRKQQQEVSAVADAGYEEPVTPGGILVDDNLGDEGLSIDELIARELAMREAETEELNRQRKKIPAQPRPKRAEIEDNIVKMINDGLAEKEEQKKNRINTSDDLLDLKEIAKKIISGEDADIDTNLKGELGELISVMVDLKHRLSEIPSNVLSTKDGLLPGVSSALSDVNSQTEKAAFNLLSGAQKIGNFYINLRYDIDELEKKLEEPVDLKGFEFKKQEIESDIHIANDLGFEILEALEFQDITEQKLRKVIKSIEEVGARLGVMVSYMKHNDDKPEYKELLTDFGFI